MPIVVPRQLPAIEILEREDIFVMDDSRASAQDIRPLRVAIVNLMPTKEVTETQLIRMLSNTPLQVHVDLLHMGSHVSANTSSEHLSRFYRTFDEVKDSRYDGMIITGAPVERMDFEDVDYWPELVQILDYARDHVFSTLFICWGAQAALHHYYGLAKQELGCKLFGVYENEVVRDDVLTRGFDRFFDAPQSRWTTITEDHLATIPDIRVLARSDDAGVHLAASSDHRFVFVSGHGEYDEDTLDREYRRDLERGDPIEVPRDYYVKGDPDRGVRMTWRSHGHLLFSNWLNYCVYQETPFDLGEIQGKVVAKFGGSSVADGAQFSQVRDIVLADDDRRHVVVSAPGRRGEQDEKVTDLLEATWRASTTKEEIEAEITRLRQRLVDTTEDRDETLRLVAGRFDEICDELGASDATRGRLHRTLREIRISTDRDFVLSRGEFLNAVIMAEYLGYDFVDAKDLIFFDAGGELDRAATEAAVRRELADQRRVVIPGFYGADPEGRIRVFARGGSDITGSIIAAAISAQLYENWTDVNGVMTADPRLDEGAQTIDVLTYEELALVARGGAAVYHPEAVDPLAAAGVPVSIKNTNDPRGTGTRVRLADDEVAGAPGEEE